MQMMPLLSRICFRRGHMGKKSCEEGVYNEGHSIVRHNRPFLLDESHDIQALLCVGLEGWDDEMMEREGQNERVCYSSVSH